MDDFLYNIGDINSMSRVQLPPKFKIRDAKKFDRSGDPKQHVQQYLSLARMKGLDEEQTIYAFPLPPTGSASRWYYSLNLGKINIWGELIEAFVEQFSYNTMIDVTLRDLEITK